MLTDGSDGNRPAVRRTTRLKQLIQRREPVLAVLGTPNAYHAKIMEAHGAEVAFVGTSITGGNYTGLPDTGVLSATECVEFAGYIARSVSFPVIIDGDTGHGGLPAVRRLVHECIRAGIAGIRLDDQPIEGKRSTQMAGLEVVSREHAVARYQAAVDAKNELDPDFVVMAQCYARDAANGGLEELITRLNLYRDEGGVDWVQFESPHSVDEIKRVRAEVSGMLTAMTGKLPRPLTLEEHAALGLTAAWYTFLPDKVLKAACWEFMETFSRQGMQTWYDFVAARPDNPFARDRGVLDLTGREQVQALDERYLSSDALSKYERSRGDLSV
jgi:2-methylisocitrate lyase-like PEP mutase family enzyme